jgi:DNA polymerase-1
VTAAAALFLVDGHQLLYRAWFGFPARIRSRDKTRDLTGVFGFLALLRKTFAAHGTGHELVVVFDAEDAAQPRIELDADYKANRAVADHTPIGSLAPVQAALDVAGIGWCELVGHEADDVIATLAYHATGPVVIYSGDRDFYQLLARPRTSVVHTPVKVVTAADVRIRYGVEPEQWPDFRALTGDPADCIAGVPGVGSRTAARLLACSRTLDDLDDSSELTPRLRQRLTEHHAKVRTWRDLIRLDHQVPVPPDLLTGAPTAPLPRPAVLLEELDLW